MKTLKQLKKECELFYTENAETYFAASFNKKMGGTQTINFQDNFIPEIKIDRRKYYSGRGAKYNTASMHENITTFVTKKEFTQKVNTRAKMLFDREMEKQEQSKKLREFCKKHGLNNKNYSGFNDVSIYFSIEKKSKIEKELNVNLTDFFNASGKTYFFAETKIGLLEFYHNNRQSYSFNFVSEERKQEFYSKRENWVKAPYAHLLGQTNNPNLFVC